MQRQLQHKFYGEVLPYLEVKKEENREEIKRIIEMPDVTGITLNEARNILKELNLDIEISGEENPNAPIINQLPKKGIQIQEGAKVTLYI